jgi:hypothetical protein
VSWFGLSLLCADLGLILVLATSHSERLWRTYRRPALLAFQGGRAVGELGDRQLRRPVRPASLLNQGPGARLGPADTAMLSEPVGTLIFNSGRPSRWSCWRWPSRCWGWRSASGTVRGAFESPTPGWLAQIKGNLI